MSQELFFNAEGSFLRTSWYNTASVTVTEHTDLISVVGSNDVDGSTPYRVATMRQKDVGSGTFSYAVETQATPANDTSWRDPRGLLGAGAKGRVMFLARVVGGGTAHAAIYFDGVQQTTPVSFTGDYWHVIDVGQDTVADFGVLETLRVWGATVHLGHLYGFHRPLFLDAAPYAALSVADPGSIASTVAKIKILGVGGVQPGVLSGVSFPMPITEQGNLYHISRIDSPYVPVGGDSIVDSIEMQAIAELKKNGTAVVAGFRTVAYRATPSAGPTVNTGTDFPLSPPNGGSIFEVAATDVLSLDLGWTNGSAHTGWWYVDKLVFCRPCSSTFWTTFNSSGTPSFAYAWSIFGDPYGIIDHYDIVVTTDVFNGHVIARYDHVTSPTTITLSPGSYNVYACPVTYDGDFSCWDRQEVIVAGTSHGQIIRYR